MAATTWLRTPPTTLSGPSAAFSTSAAADPRTPATVGYAPYQWEPGRHFFTSADGKFKVSDGLELNITPYYFHQQSGSTGETVLKEAAYKNGFLSSPIGAFSAYGTSNTNALLVQMSQSDFDRVGNTASLTGHIQNHVLTASAWTEYTNQRQLNPFEQINTSTNTIPDIWFKSNLLRDQDGNIVTNRDWVTNYYNNAVSLSDGVSMLNDALHVDVSARERFYDRSFHNLPAGSSLSNAYLDYMVKRNYQFFLPSFGARYDLDKADQVFFNASTNARVPPNFVDGRLIDNTSNTITVPTIKAERATSFDLGYRYKGDYFDFNATGYLIKYRNRIAVTANNDGSLTSKYTNIGSTTSTGTELEVGSKPVEGWSVLVSQTFNKDTLDTNIISDDGTNTVLPTKGKQFFNSPRYITNGTLLYDRGPYYGFVRAKYTGPVFATLTNDVSLHGYANFDMGLGYRLKDTALLKAIPGAKNGELKLNMTNVLNAKYLYINPGNSTGIQITSAGNPAFYLGAPFAVTASLTVDF